MGQLFNLARMTTATTGTGTMTLGSAVAPYLSFANAGATNGVVVTYAIRDGNNSEIGNGTYTSSGTTLSRDHVFNSTNGGSKISLSGSAQVIITEATTDVQQLYSATMFGAIGDGSNDDTAAINAWLAAIASGSKTGFLPNGTYKITSALTAVTGSNWGVTGGGSYTATLSYQGASATNDIFVVGDGSNTYQNIYLSNFRMTTTTTMSAGYAIRFKKINSYVLNGVIFEGAFPEPGNKKLFNGFYADGSSWGDLLNSSFWLLGTAITAANGVELNVDQVNIINPGVDGIHVGGGFGGLYTGYVAISGAGVGMRVDATLTGSSNSQVFISERTVIDTCTSAAYYIDDVFAGSKTIVMNGWGASTSGGNGFVVINWNGGTISFIGAQLIANSQAGIYLGDASTIVTIDASTNILGNGGFGVFGNVSINVYSLANPLSNSSGAYSTNVNLWQSFTPTITSASGTLTTATGTCFYTRMAKTIIFTLTATVTTNGTGATAINATLPATAQTAAVVSGRDTTVTGKMLQGIVNASAATLNIFFYDNTYPGANGAILVVSGSYQST